MTVIIPVRNRPKLLLEAINSVLKQTSLPREIIVVDDASTTEVELSGLDSEVPIRCIRNNQRLGAQYSRLRGVRAANSELVAFLDSDDIWLEHWIESQVSVILSMEGRATWSTCAGFLGSQGSSEVTEISPRAKFDGSYLSAIEKPCTLGFSSFLVSKDLVLESKALETKIPAYQEWYAVIKMSRIARGVINTSHLFVWRPGDDSISKGVWKSQLSMLLLTLTSNMSLLAIGARMHSLVQSARRFVRGESYCRGSSQSGDEGSAS